VQRAEGDWHVYRTRFLIRARQLSAPLAFRDLLGREHHGQTGDYLIESSDGTQRIAPREIFEDIYVAMNFSGANRKTTNRKTSVRSSLKKARASGYIKTVMGQHPTC
jgi:hypothetical protein